MTTGTATNLNVGSEGVHSVCLLGSAINNKGTRNQEPCHRVT